MSAQEKNKDKKIKHDSCSCGVTGKLVYYISSYMRNFGKKI